jgi:tRNA pseudouridine38-40 synthase
MTVDKSYLQNYKIVLSYDGTDYHGWQRQPKKRTIQGMIEGALSKIAQKKIAVVGAGRTDAGVHAQGQVANFKAAFKIAEAELLNGLNALLPDDIRVTDLEKVPLDFDARRNARRKIYQYRIWHSRKINPFVFRYVLHWPYPFDLKPMRDAARRFQRIGDFSGFSSNRLLHPVRNVARSELHKKGDEIVFTIEASGFLRYMVRTIVGTILEVGRGRISPEAVEEIFKDKKRTLASPTAPAKGLCLVKILY